MTQDKDTRIAELEAEVERLTKEAESYRDIAARKSNQVADMIHTEALSRTGAVKVLQKLVREDLRGAPPNAEVWIGGWSTYSGIRDDGKVHVDEILSALEPAATEVQQPVAWMDATGTELHKIIQDYQKRDMIASGGRQAERAPNYSIALFTAPSEQAVTEAMVDAVVEAIRPYTRDTLFLDEHQILVREALKAAMEAGR